MEINAVRINISQPSLLDIANTLEHQLTDLKAQVIVVEEFAKILSKDYSKEEEEMKNIEPPLEPKYWEDEDEMQEVIDSDYEEYLEMFYYQQQ